MSPLSVKASTLLLSCAAALALAGCGGGGADSASDSDPLAVYKNQEINWGSCTQYVSDGDDYAAYVAQLGDRVQCADVAAPLDYQNPKGLQVSVSLLRVKAADSPDQKPNLFFNPGGPGGDGQKESLDFFILLANGSPNSELGRKYKEVSESYNFVGFSPRGVGDSTNIVCAGNELVYETDDTKWGDDADNIRKLTDSARYTARNCQKNPVADYIHTDGTARDMDLMRHLLGDEKLHYYGISYGTWLGFWYAGIFPDRVGPMVLDSNMNFSNSIHEASISYINGQLHTFEHFVAPYVARHDHIFHMGTTAQAIVDDVKGLGPKVSQALLDIEGFRAEREGLPFYISAVKAAIETQRGIDSSKSLDDIRTELTQGIHIDDNDSDINKIFHYQANRLIARIEAREDPDFYIEPSHFALGNSDSVWNTVVCNDEPVQNNDEQFWIGKGFELAGRMPIAGNRVASQPCLYWNWKSNVSKPSMESLKDAPLLMVQSQFDVPTPLSGAMQTFDMLSAASMVRIEQEGAHGLMVYQTECVDITVMDHLLGKAPSQRLTECQAKPLPHDTPLLHARIAMAATVDPQPASNFEQPELADKLIASLRAAAGR